MPFEGEVTFRDLDFRNIIIPGPGAPISERVGIQCCFAWPVFADLNNSDPIRNDYKSFIVFLDSTFSVSFKIQQYIGCAWIDIAEITDGTYGELFDNLRIKENIKPWGFRLDFLKLLTQEGPGIYRVEIDYGQGAYVTDDYDLKHYNDYSVDNTTRFTFIKDSVVGSDDPQFENDYTGLSWSDQIRVPNSSMHSAGAPLSKEVVRRENGFRFPYEKNYINEFSYIVEAAGPQVIQSLKFVFVDTNFISVVDYNIDALNPIGIFRERFVDIKGDYDVKPDRNSPLTPIELTLEDAYELTRKRHS